MCGNFLDKAVLVVYCIPVFLVVLLRFYFSFAFYWHVCACLYSGLTGVANGPFFNRQVTVCDRLTH